MKVVSFVTQKGGSGKSTTAASIAVAAFQQGRRVFLLELDRQGTLSDWADARQAEEGPEFERIDATAIEKALATLKGAGYDLAVVDTPGVDSPATVAPDRSVEQYKDLAAVALPIGHAGELAALIVDRTIQIERTPIARVRRNRPREMAPLQTQCVGPARKPTLGVWAEVRGSEEDARHGRFDMDNPIEIGGYSD